MNNKSKNNKKFVKRIVDEGPWCWLFPESMPPETYEKIFKEVDQMLESNKPLN